MSLVGAGVTWWAAERGAAATIDGTASLVTDNNGSTTPLTSGNSDTLFGVNLQPSAQAANGIVNSRPDCSADSATGGTFVYTYLIHQGEDPTKLNMSGGEPGTLPDKSMTLALYDSGGNIQTDPTTQNTASGTGQILLPPTQQFQWGQITASTGGGVPLTGSGGLLYSGTTGVWHGGYLCFKNGTASPVTDWWGFTITFTQDNTSNGGGQHFTWSVLPDSAASPTTTTTTATTTVTTTATTTASSDTTPSDSTTTTPDSGSSGQPGSGSASSGGGSPTGGTGSGAASGQLPLTGVPVRPLLSIAILLTMTGVLCLMVSIGLSEQGSRRLRRVSFHSQ